MSVTLCVLLSAVPGNEQLLIDYEDRVLELLAGHEGRVLHRVRAIDPRSAPFEVQLIEFASEAALEGFMSDPRGRPCPGCATARWRPPRWCVWRSCRRSPDGLRGQPALVVEIHTAGVPGAMEPEMDSCQLVGGRGGMGRSGRRPSIKSLERLGREGHRGITAAGGV
jgi:hypothetical protein